ncbi:hypothetical protein ACI2KR_06640 [Pseudomonas luteola]
MKFICAAMLSLITSAALAADDTNLMAYNKVLWAAMVSAVCNAKTQPSFQVGADGSINQIYDASTKDLHRCQYMTEIIASGCVQTENCQSYDDWTRANTAISPTLPHDVFLSAILARKAASIDNPTDHGKHHEL